MKKALIISGGEFHNFTSSIEYDIVIACDKGYEYAQKLKITPDIVLGDFDSVDADALVHISSDIPVYTHPVEKDDTDTMLSIKKAIELGCNEITIICALGNRLDHTIANIQSVHYAANAGISCEIISYREYLKAYKGPSNIAIEPREGYSLSLFSLTDSCKDLSISGAKYNADSICLKNSFPLGLGNSFRENTVNIKFSEGILLISQSKM